MRFSIPAWLKELVDQVNQSGGEGMPGLLRRFPLFNRLGLLIDHDGFFTDLTALIDRYEASERKQQSQAERLKGLKYPNLQGKNWKAELHTWMQEVLDAFLGFHVEVPEPPSLNRAQRRLLMKYKLWLFFVPMIEESQCPKHMVRLDWNKYLKGADVRPLPLPGRWIAFEVIRKPNYQDGRYPNDQLMADVGSDTRFAHPHSDKGEGDDLMQDTLPKVTKILASLGGETKVQSARVFNFMGNLFNWLWVHTSENRLPNLGSTNSVEWCEERYGSLDAFIVGHCGNGGLAYVHNHWRDGRDDDIGFRFLVQF
ncbi:hypothetical protein HZA87_03820 [Candidatus Uhrbacteria bacterium]|nr:hypothetical protein [Candidatus Uhrbacteria bacterium]